MYDYTDTSAIAQSEKVFYRIAGVKWVPCYPEGHKKAGAGPFSQSVSNLEDNKIKGSGINTVYYNSNFKLFVLPNPVTKSSAIKYILPKNAEVNAYLINILGETVAKINVGKQSAGANQFMLNVEKLNLSGGMYFLKVLEGNSKAISKIAIIK